MEIENELKIYLNKYEFYNILNKTTIVNESVQQNFYFDTPEFHLYKNDITLRVRFENLSYILTLKIKNKSSNILTQSYEYNKSIGIFDTNTLENNLELILKTLFTLDIPYEIHSILSNITYVGCIKNHRYTLSHKDIPMTFELDETLFLENIHEYELEIENFSEDYLPLLKHFNINIENLNKQSKYKRFINHLTGNQK